jgi:hypothetical protein
MPEDYPLFSYARPSRRLDPPVLAALVEQREKGERRRRHLNDPLQLIHHRTSFPLARPAADLRAFRPRCQPVQERERVVGELAR